MEATMPAASDAEAWEVLMARFSSKSSPELLLLLLPVGLSEPQELNPMARSMIRVMGSKSWRNRRTVVLPCDGMACCLS